MSDYREDEQTAVGGEKVEGTRSVDLAKVIKGACSVPSQQQLCRLLSLRDRDYQQFFDEPSHTFPTNAESLRFIGNNYVYFFPPDHLERDGTYKPYLGEIRRAEFNLGVSLLQTPQIERQLEYLHDIWIQLENRQIGNPDKDNYEEAQDCVMDFSRELACEWKKRVPEGSSPGLSLLRHFCPQATDQAIFRMTRYRLIQSLAGKRVQSGNFAKDEPADVSDYWLSNLLENYKSNHYHHDLKDPCRIAMLFGSNPSNTLNIYDGFSHDVDASIVSSLNNFTAADLPILQQWIHDLRELAPALNADIAELKRSGVSIPQVREIKIPLTSRLGFYCTTAYKILTKDPSWQTDLQQMASSQIPRQTDRLFLEETARLVTCIAPQEGYQMAQKVFQQVLSSSAADWDEAMARLHPFDREIADCVRWKALDGLPPYASLTPLILQLPVQMLENTASYSRMPMFKTTSHWSFKPDLAELFMASASRQWSAMPSVEPEKNIHLAEYFADSMYHAVIRQAASSVKKWAVGKVPGEMVNLGDCTINRQMIEQLLYICAPLEKTSPLKPCYDPDSPDLDPLNGLGAKDLVSLINNLYANHWQNEAESMFCVNADIGTAYWVRTDHVEKTRDALLKRNKDGYFIDATSLTNPFFKKLTASQIAELTGSSVQGIEEEYYVMPMNKVVGYMVQHAYGQLLRTDPAVFEQEVCRMITNDDNVPLSAKLALLQECDWEGLCGSIKELAYLRDQLALSLKGLLGEGEQKEKEIAGYAEALLPIGFGISTRTASQLTSLTPEQYHLAVRNRIQAALLPLVQQSVITMGGKQMAMIDGIRQKIDVSPFSGTIVDALRLGQHTPMVQMAAVGRLAGDGPVSYSDGRVPLASLVSGKDFERAVTFPFPEDYVPKDAKESIMMHGIRALQWNDFILLLRKGELPEYVCSHIFLKTEPADTCLMPDYQTVARPIQSELFQRYGREIQEAIEEALHCHPDFFGEQGSDYDIPILPVIPPFNANLPKLPTTPLLSQPAVSFENQGQEAQPHTITIEGRHINLTQLTNYVVSRLRDHRTPEEISALFQEFGPSFRYWMYSRDPSSTKPAEKTVFPAQSDVLNTLEQLLRLVIFSDAGRQRFDQFTKATQANNKLSSFTKEVMDAINFYVKNS